MGKKKELVPSAPVSRQAAFLQRMKDGGSSIQSASDLMKSWKFVDFFNPKTDLPSISLEWLYGARGLLAGRIIQFRAKYSKGKSSFMYLMYACAQKRHDAYCLHVETEGASAPADYIAAFGANPGTLAVDEIESLEECIEKVDTVVCEIRGGFEGTVSEEGRKLKTKFTEPLDPNNECPIIIGIDSLSSLGIKSGVGVDVMDAGDTPQISYHSKKLREYFRNRVGRFRDTQTLLMLASHETGKIEVGKRHFGGSPGSDKTSLGQEAVGIHATYGADLDNRPWMDKTVGRQVGDIVTMFTFKNKLSPRNRKLELYLVSGQGFDLTKTDVEFLMNHPASPFAVPEDSTDKKPLYRSAHGIHCKALSDKPFKTDEEFLRAFYANEDILKGCREVLRIRGYGLEFESKYAPPDIDAEDADGGVEPDATAAAPASE